MKFQFRFYQTIYKQFRKEYVVLKRCSFFYLLMALFKFHRLKLRKQHF